MSKWSDYQSIISMSLALNAAYFSISGFVSPYAAKLRELINANNREAKLIKLESDKREILQKITEISKNISANESDEKLFVERSKWVSVSAFLIGFLMLFISSVCAENEAGVWPAILSFFLCLPFLVGVFYMTVTISGKYKSIRKDREDLEIKINQKICDQT